MQYNSFFEEEKNKRNKTNKDEYSKEIKPFFDSSIDNEYKGLTFDSTYYDLDYKKQIIKLSQDLNKLEDRTTKRFSVNNPYINNSFIEEEFTPQETYVNKKNNKEAIQQLILNLPRQEIEELTDGYHSFKELYDFKRVYNSALFNLLHQTQFCRVWKSYKHYEGDLCFGGNWFIVVAELPTGQISNHYENKYWEEFNIPVVEKSLIEWDNPQAKDVIERLTNLYKTI